MPALYEYRLFLSHAWAYEEHYLGVIELLNQANYFAYRNYSIPKDKAFDTMSANGLKEQLREQIRPVQVVVIIGGMYVAHSDWIQFEIDFAKSLGKKILGIRPRGAERLPTAVQDTSNKIVNWNTISIVDGVRELVR